MQTRNKDVLDVSNATTVKAAKFMKSWAIDRRTGERSDCGCDQRLHPEGPGPGNEQRRYSFGGQHGGGGFRSLTHLNLEGSSTRHIGA